MVSKKPEVVVIGCGLSGSMAALHASDAGAHVTLISTAYPIRSSSVCMREGVNAALDTAGEDDSPSSHAADSIKFGADLAGGDEVMAMCEAAPGIVRLLERMGVPFDLTPEGFIRQSRGEGSGRNRMAFSGPLTSQRILNVLDGQLRKSSAVGKISAFVGWEFLSPIIDDSGASRGAVAINTKSMEVKSFPADAVIICSGGYSSMFAQTTRSLYCDGFAAVSCYRRGATFANPEFVQFFPLTFEAFGKFIPVRREMISDDGTAIEGALTENDSNLLRIYEEITGDDPFETPMNLLPAAGYSPGGLLVDDRHATDVPGLFSAGEASCRYGGAAAMPGDEILSSLYGGMIAGRSAAEFSMSAEKSCDEIDVGIFERAKSSEERKNSEIASVEGKENGHVIAGELKRLLFSCAGPSRNNGDLEVAGGSIAELKARSGSAPLLDRSEWANGEVIFMRRLSMRFDMANLITRAALARDESRGSHVKPEFPNRDDGRWRVITRARWSDDGPKFDYMQKPDSK